MPDSPKSTGSCPCGARSPDHCPGGDDKGRCQWQAAQQPTPAERFAAMIVRPLLRGDINDLNGFDLQDMAEAAGLIAPVEAAEACGEFCGCAEFDGGFPTTCYRLTEAGKALPND